MTPRLPPLPDLDWSAPDGSESAAPRAGGDVYFSRDGGLAETEAVFLAGCDLPAAWRGRDRFAVGELGFGSGLNALATWALWRRTRAPGAVLHYTSIENAPMQAEDAQRAHAAFPEIAALSAALIARWPVRAYGAQRLSFDEDGFCLTILVADAARALDGLRGAMDAWFLDGFSPALNPEMWSAPVLRRVADLSAPGAAVATYSVAGAVRRGLSEAGFTVARKPGFGRKRERLEARRDAMAQARAHTLYPYAPSLGRDAVIIGGGIAAAALAHALARRGVAATLVTRGAALGDGASGNPAALVMPRLDRGDTPDAALHRAAYLYALDLYRELGVLDACGVMETPQSADDRAALADLLRDPPLPDAALRAAPDGALHPQAGLVNPARLLAALSDRATIVANADVARLAREAGRWTLIGADGETLASADCVILANGPGLSAFAQTDFLPLAAVRGQIEWGPLQGAPLRHARADGAYVAPFEHGVLFGATHDPAALTDRPAPDGDARARNLAQLAALAPDIAARIDPAALRSRASVRATTPDRAPIAGLCPDAPAWRARFAGLAQGRALDLSAPAPAHEGLYLLGGLGSRGFTLAPLLADRVASELCGEPQALPIACLDAIHPARFLARAIKRGL